MYGAHPTTRSLGVRAASTTMRGFILPTPGVGLCHSRAESRLGVSAHFIVADLNEPSRFLDKFSSMYPDASSELVSDEDASFLVDLCKRRGQKPVNFIPRLDANFEHWFKEYSLWQTEDVDAVM